MFISSKCVLLEPGKTLEYNASSLKRDHLTSLIPIPSPVSLSCAIVLADTSSSVLNKSRELTTCLTPNFRGNVFSFCSCSEILAMDLSQTTFTVLSCALSTSDFFSVILIRRDIELC